MSAQPGGFKLRRELIQDEILEQLRKSIVAGSFRPGERLNEASLCEQFGVSRAPVREALKQLVAEGLLVKIPHKGCFVVELTAKDIREIYSLRHALEILAVKLVVENVVPEQLEPLRMILTEMKASIDQRDTWRTVDLDMRFHETLCLLSGHSRLHRVWSHISSQLRGFFAVADRLYEQNQLVERHQALIDAIESGDKERAIRTIEKHIVDSAEHVIRTTITSTAFPPEENA